MSTPSDSKSSVPETSSTPIDAQDAKPDRSRNAKAQARHRAKRKAYIEQLESTVTELKAALAENGSKSVDDKITALTEENQRLREELQRLRVQAEQHLNGEPSAKKRRVSTEEDSSYLGPMMLSDSPRAASHGLNGAKLDVPQLRAPPHIQQHHMPLTQPLNIGSLHFTQDRPASAQSTSSQKPRIGPSPLGFPNGIPSYAQTGQSQPHLMVARHSLPTNSLSSYPVVGTTSPATPSSSAGPSPYSLHPGQSSGSYDEFNFPGHGLSNGLASLTSAVRDTTLGMDMVSTPQSLSSQSDTYTVRSDPPPPYIPSLFPSSPAFPNGQASQSFSSIPPFIGFSSALTDDAKSDTNVLPPFLQSNHLFTPSHNRRQSGSSPSLTASSASSPELPGTPFSSYESQLPIAPKPNPPVWSLSPYDTSMSTTVSFVLGAQLPTSLSGSDSHLRSGNSDGSGNILGEGWYNPAIPTHPPQQGQDS